MMILNLRLKPSPDFLGISNGFRRHISTCSSGLNQNIVKIYFRCVKLQKSRGWSWNFRQQKRSLQRCLGAINLGSWLQLWPDTTSVSITWVLNKLLSTACAITLFRAEFEDRMIKELGRKLTAEGFQIYGTILGADGVGVLWPAVFQNNTWKSRRRDWSEFFENADGAEGIN